MNIKGALSANLVQVFLSFLILTLLLLSSSVVAVSITRPAQVSSAGRCPTRSHFTALCRAVSPMITDPLFNPGWTVLQGVEPPADPCTQFTL